MTQSSAAGNWDAWNRLCGALASRCALGSTVDDWHADPGRYPVAHAYLWQHGGTLVMDEAEHEISNEARRIGADLLDTYEHRSRTGGWDALARKHKIHVERLKRIHARADDLRSLGDPLTAH
jgi:hypothetical protein